ncbi:aromatic ring-hydroxylating dioxygenase subunit alpha [Streptomyces hirsutus]|uniref:aromatic ring-hydroxylating dioxygenase subunit alpha n=1 Tax=Streptomyces hirsutus TaxID=35620 RepID=UPI0034206E10
MAEYVKNTWYPLTWSRDVTGELSRHRILERDVVLYRTADGKVAAMEDMCPHRLLPLSMGRLKGDAVECGYHGMTFESGGRCIRVPGQSGPVPDIRVTTYPTHENMGLVWIWMGDPELADTDLVFDLPEYHSEAWNVAEGDALRIEADYLSLADNLCDPAHVNFVHLSTLGNEAGEDVPVTTELRGDDLVTWRWINDAPAIPLFAKFGNFTGNVDRWHYYHYLAPSIAVIDFGSLDSGRTNPEDHRDEGMRIFACHFITPVDAHTSIDHWMHVKNFHADEATNKALSDQFRIAFAEDKSVLEAIQINELAHPDRRKARIAIDRAPIRMRRMVEQWIAKDVPPQQAPRVLDTVHA